MRCTLVKTQDAETRKVTEVDKQRTEMYSDIYIQINTEN